ncbi:MAG: hypothetical protein ACRC1H_02850 [Caldilineaceae bacterium]
MRRTLLLLLVLLALVVAPLSAFAQDNMPPVPCGNLADEDCDFLKESREVMQALETYSADVSVDVSLANVPSLPADAGFSLESSGSFVLSPEVNQAMMEMQQDPAAMVENMDEFMQTAIDFYSETQFDMELALGVSEGLADLLAAQAGMPLPESLDLAMRMVDGVVYINADSIAELTGDDSISGWLGIDMVGALEQSTEQMLEAMQSGDMMDPAALSSALAGVNSQQMMAEQFVEYVDVERLEDSEVDGVAVAQFLYTFDLAGFVASPEFVEMLSAQIEQQMAMQDAMGQAPPMSEEDLAMITEMLPMFAPMLLSGVEWETVSAIGIEDGYLYTTETSVEWDLAQVASMAGAMMGGEMGGPARGADEAMFSMSVFAQNYDFGADIVIEAPEDATMVPLDGMSTPTM